MIGTRAGSYLITDVINVGGMGAVYRAEHTLIGRIAAVKVLHPEMSVNREIIQRFFNEARITTSIKHPGILEVYDFGYLDSGQAYLVMEFLEGESLAARNKRGPMTEGEAAAILRGVCSALAAAHAKGVIHRDLKPDNIFLVPDPESALGYRPKILDFGIAKLTDIGLNTSATRTGAVLGTPTYMSPEQCRGTGELDNRADLYSLGCVFYELVTGRPPLVALGAGEVIAAHLFLEPDPPSRHAPGITPETEALILALLAKDPAHRPQTASELAQLLAQVAKRSGWRSSASWDAAPPGFTTVPPGFTPAPPSLTPAPRLTPPGFTPPGLTPPLGRTQPPPSPSGPITAPSMPTIRHTASERPTTLSGSASHSISRPAPRKLRWLAAPIALVALVGVVAFAVAVRGGRTGARSAAAPPSPSIPAAPPAPSPTPPPPPVAPVVREPPAPVAPTPSEPAPAKPAVAPSAPAKPAFAPTPSEPAPAKPAVALSAPAKPAVAPSALAKPVTPSEPAPAKPAAPPAEAAKASPVTDPGKKPAAKKPPPRAPAPRRPDDDLPFVPTGH